MVQSEEALENPRDNHLPILKGLNRCGGVGLMPRGFGETLAGLGGAFTRVPRGTLPIGTSDQQQKLPTRPYAHGVQPFAGLSATRLVTQGSLASSATSRPPTEHSYSPPPPRWADLWNAFGVALCEPAKFITGL